MAPPRTRSKAVARTGGQVETGRSQASRTQRSDDEASSMSPRVDATGEQSQRQLVDPPGVLPEASGVVRSHGHTPERQAPRRSAGDRSPAPRGDDLPRGDLAGAAGQQSAPAPPGIHGPGDALAAAEALLQFPPVPVEDMPRMTAWLARLAGLVGYAHNLRSQCDPALRLERRSRPVAPCPRGGRRGATMPLPA